MHVRNTQPVHAAGAPTNVRHRACPLCGSFAPRRLCRRGYWIRGCPHCGHRFAEFAPPPAHASRVYGDAYFFGGGAGYDDYLSHADLLMQRGRRYAGLMSRHVPAGSVLDVGAAAGFLLKGFVDCGWNGTGIEPNPAMCRFAREQLGLDVRCGTLERAALRERYDLVLMVQVAAHFADVRRALSNAAELTRPGGYWLIETWNPASWTARLFGRYWHEYNPPSVLHWFTPETLARWGRRLGFLPVACGRPVKWLRSGHAKSLLRHQLGTTWLGRVLALGTGLIPDRLKLPYPGDDLYWMLLQKDAG